MKRNRTLLALLVAFAMFAAACGGDDDDDGGSEGAPEDIEVPEGPDITIGAQNFGESAILAQIYGQALDAAGYPVSYQDVGGFRDVSFAAFESGDINMTAEYAASALEFLNEFAGEASNDADATVEALKPRLEEKDIVAYDYAPAVDTNSFVVTQETADEFGLESIADLAENASELRLGGPPDCEENAFCIPGLKEVYDVDLSANFVSLDGGGPLTVEALQGDEIDVAVLFTTNGVIAEEGWVILEDPEGLFNADNVIPIATNEVDEAYGEDFASVLNAVSAQLTTEELTELNRRFDIDKEDADVIAKDWLTEYDLI
jgi:osmoprotectant transport system substrate-binding protein